MTSFIPENKYLTIFPPITKIPPNPTIAFKKVAPKRATCADDDCDGYDDGYGDGCDGYDDDDMVMMMIVMIMIMMMILMMMLMIVMFT
jgi:hypothetical protein